MTTEVIVKESEKQDEIRILVCGEADEFTKSLKDYCGSHYPFVKVEKGFQSINEIIEYASKESVDIAFIQLQQFINIEKEQAELSSTNLSKVIIMTDRLDLFKSTIVLQEPFAELMYIHTPMRVLTERMLTFDAKKKLRLYTNTHPTIRKQEKGRSVLIYSAKGGVGKSTIAVNVACQLAKKDKRVLLVDFATFGNIQVMVNLPRNVRGMSEAIGVLEQPMKTDEELQKYLEDGIHTMQVQGSRLDVLAAATPMKMTSLDLEKTDDLVAAIQRLDYDVILFDTSSDLTEKNISLISSATDIIYVSTTDIAASWSLLSTIDLVETLNRPLQNRYLVVNHYNDSLGFPVNELESILSMKVAAVIPDKYEQIQGYTNRGILLAEKQNLKINRSYKQIAHLIEPVFTEKELGIKKRKRWLARGGDQR
ncbi:AAA family ATPase [Halalkalibacter krulwichiae]|uniref:Flagellum site-determining protein YlxH n=1 Tax=Halalkalibacter krulwichiae TaxID=199441 RepID=A0A1X9MHK9_9BACI|nr:MinD/ParA family protein [Halalkalibacter krulwichiae]ARK32000.1 Flagellum site-determining protein YlxH [Halalkalibacter krulwichiae]